MRPRSFLWFGLIPALAGAAEPRGAFPYPVASRTLENGLAVHVVTMPTPGVVAAYVWMEVGSRDEVDPGRTGFAHFFEHLFFYGTPTRPHEAREREILLLGADENAWTDRDETVYHAVLSKEALPAYLAMQADNFQMLTLTDADVRKEAGAVYGEYRKNQADPTNRLYESLVGAAFTTHTYRHDTIGYEADIAAMPTAHGYASEFFDRMYRPENATIVIAGDADPEAVFRMVEKDWAAWKRGATARPQIPAEPAQKGARRIEVAWPTPTAAQLMMGWKGPAWRADREVAALELAASILGSEVGPLRRRLVEEEGLAYDVYVGSDLNVDPGLFTVAVTLKEPGHLARAEAIVREEVQKLAAAADPAIVERTRTRERYSFLTALDDPDTVAAVVGSTTRRAGSPEGIDAWWAAYDAVTPADVSAAVKKWLADDTLTIGTLSHQEAK
jgi:zinc protease